MEYKIIEKIAVISQRGTWAKELNIVKWGEHDPKYDVRDWNGDHTKCGKGLTLTEDEVKVLISALQQRL